MTAQNNPTQNNLAPTLDAYASSWGHSRVTLA
jgi:hypothetical protein